MAEKVDADVVLANDPDADRLGVYAKDSKTGEYHSFTGNMSGTTYTFSNPSSLSARLAGIFPVP